MIRIRGLSTHGDDCQVPPRRSTTACTHCVFSKMNVPVALVFTVNTICAAKIALDSPTRFPCVCFKAIGERGSPPRVMCQDQQHAGPAPPEVGILLPNNQRKHHTLHIQKDVLLGAVC